MTYPILLDLRGRLVVVVGGGIVAARKVADLVAAGAEVVVISPSVHPSLIKLASRVDVRSVEYAPGLLSKLIDSQMKPLLVFAATNIAEVNAQVADEARRLGILVDVVDDADGGDFASMAALRRGSITIGVSTGGASPALAAHLRDLLEGLIGDEYTILAQWLSESRPLLRSKLDSAARRELARAIFASPALALLRDGDEAGARAIIDSLIAHATDES